MPDTQQKTHQHPVSLKKKPLLGVGIRLILLVVSVAFGIFIKEILILGFISLVFSIGLSYPIRLFSKWTPRGIAVLITLGLLLLGIGSLGAFTFPKIYEQGQSVLLRLPKAVDQLESWFAKIKSTQPIAQLPKGEVASLPLGSQLEKWTESHVGAIIPAAKGLVGFVSEAVFVLVLTAFLAYQPEGYRNGLRNLVPKNKEFIFDEAYQRISHGFGRWMIGILISMTLMGTLTGIGLSIVGIEDWFFLATLTFLGTSVPYVGALISAIPGLLIGLSQSFEHFLLASVVYLCVHIIEGYIVEPLIMKQTVQIRPAVLLFGQGVLGTLFGVLGIAIAAPLLVFGQILIGYLYIERHLKKGRELPTS
jgi:predicted PurR-regulated permease PerM